MHSTALKRLKANFCYFNQFSRNFCQNQTKSDSEPLPKPDAFEKKVFEGILYKQHTKSVLEITINQPKKLNSVDLKMIKNLLKRVKQWMPDLDLTTTSGEETDSEKARVEEESIPRVVLMSGAGDKSFCAGGDITALYELNKGGEKNLKQIKDFFRYEYLLDYLLSKMNPIQVAIWNGYVMGGGVGLSIHAPIRIATDNSLFAMPETAIGLFPDVGGSYFLPRLFNSEIEIGLYMGLTGDRLKGKELAQCGVATHFVPADKIDKLKSAIIEKSNKDTDLKKVQEIVREFSEIVYSPDTFYFPKHEEIKKAFQPTTLEDIHKSLERLSTKGTEEEQKWAQNVLKTLSNNSLISQAVTIEQLKRGSTIKSKEEAFNMEAQLIAGFVEDSDFWEGVRARLIEKDNKPNWKYKSYKEINNDEIIRKYFERSEEINVDPNK